jgi:hypothetical protein
MKKNNAFKQNALKKPKAYSSKQLNKAFREDLIQKRYYLSS